jgi:solute carrier family 27 fatty acid transporter 1/4
MENRPEYICIWLGLSKLGVISALINTNLKAQALVHSINISNPKAVIYSHELSERKSFYYKSFNT